MIREIPSRKKDPIPLNRTELPSGYLRSRVLLGEFNRIKLFGDIEIPAVMGDHTCEFKYRVCISPTAS